jgi:UDPglucose 6-dehydrogenase
MNDKVGFIGQGWIGRHYADDFERRGYDVVRYALEAPYHKNKDAIQDCKIVFIAVPTPSTPEGFLTHAVESALSNLAKGSTAVIKSTLLPGTTTKLQSQFSDLYVMHSPEFLREATAAHDASNPSRNIIGIPVLNDIYLEKAETVHKVLPSAPYKQTMPAMEAEFVKYAGNCFLYTKTVFMNALYDLTEANGVDFNLVREALISDERIGDSHTSPIHASGHDQENSRPVRGAGGHCFIKDFEAFRRLYAETKGDDLALKMFNSIVEYNNYLLINSQKDLDLLEAVYGEEINKNNT